MVQMLNPRKAVSWLTMKFGEKSYIGAIIFRKNKIIYKRAYMSGNLQVL
jgi:hypothetical protein